MRTIIFVLLISAFVNSAPSHSVNKKNSNHIHNVNENSDLSRNMQTGTLDADVEKSLEQFLNNYYNKFLKNQINKELLEILDGGDGDERKNMEGKSKTENIYDQMQGDQPVPENVMPFENRQFFGNLTNPENKRKNISNTQYLDTMRDRFRDSGLEERTREYWIQKLKENVLRATGRSNLTANIKPIENIRIPTSNISDIIKDVLNNSNIIHDDQITEKIRSFYPLCEIPSNAEQDMWKDENTMNLYFNFDYLSDEKNVNIATATLRLYRLPENATKLTIRPGDCDFNSTEEEKLIRVSIYWYTKSRKRRVKRRLSDSKVISESSKWVELSVKPATKAWSKGRNLGLGVLVEDQEGNALKADKYFKGPSCMVGTSTPKPIPTIIIDAVRKTNELNRIHGVHGRNATSAVYSDVLLFPIIDVCTLEFPANYTHPPHLSNLRINACNLKKMHDQAQKLVEKERLERLVTLPEIFAPRHIRHQRQHNKISPESVGIVDSRVIFTKKQLENYFNSTIIDR